MAKKIREMSIRERFNAKGFGVVKYARAHKLSQPILSYILSENKDVTGRQNNGRGVTRKAYTQLKSDGVYIGTLPWESCG